MNFCNATVAPVPMDSLGTGASKSVAVVPHPNPASLNLVLGAPLLGGSAGSLQGTWPLRLASLIARSIRSVVAPGS